jgi:hypothetical protein
MRVGGPELSGHTGQASGVRSSIVYGLRRIEVTQRGLVRALR